MPIVSIQLQLLVLKIRAREANLLCVVVCKTGRLVIAVFIFCIYKIIFNFTLK